MDVPLRQDAFVIQKLWLEMVRAVRNIGWRSVRVRHFRCRNAF
jgi:hypothetical protein